MARCLLDAGADKEKTASDPYDYKVISVAINIGGTRTMVALWDDVYAGDYPYWKCFLGVLGKSGIRTRTRDDCPRPRMILSVAGGPMPTGRSTMDSSQ